MLRFEDQVAIVTGAGNGIGLALAHAYAAEGAEVVVAEITPASGQRAVEEITAAGGKAILIPTDVSDEAQVEAMVEATVDQLGRIDILVNNAGIVVHKKLVDLEREAWDRQLEVQLTGPFLTTKHVAKHMIARGGGGKIVNISSVSAVMGRIKGGPHCAAKGGLTMLTKVAAMELAEYGVNVNAVAPGLIDVPAQRVEENLSSEYQTRYMQEVPLGRMGLPQDIAKMVLFLSSDEADWITGQLYLVDGGLMSGHYTFTGSHDFVMLNGH
ncbi:MAG: 3-oxoacyl-ACP reductase family protein [Anaerolineae bacterium]|jgi:NAD(P)-dependent dehydrogenase (short-subunit alcohol dehydrogenase family)